MSSPVIHSLCVKDILRWVLKWSAKFLSIFVVRFLLIFFILSQVDRRKQGYARRFHIFAVVTAHDYLRLYRIDVIIIASGQTNQNVTKTAS